MFSTRGAIIIRKGYSHAAKIDNELMWLDALGINHKGERRNQGISAPDAGSCSEVGTRKTCKLPSGSKYYTWADRDKEMPNY